MPLLPFLSHTLLFPLTSTESSSPWPFLFLLHLLLLVSASLTSSACTPHPYILAFLLHKLLHLLSATNSIVSLLLTALTPSTLLPYTLPHIPFLHLPFHLYSFLPLPFLLLPILLFSCLPLAALFPVAVLHIYPVSDTFFVPMFAMSICLSVCLSSQSACHSSFKVLSPYASYPLSAPLPSLSLCSPYEMPSNNCIACLLPSLASNAASAASVKNMEIDFLFS